MRTKCDKLGFMGELSKPSPVGEGGPPMAVDEEFFMFVTTHPSARQYLILTILCTLLASTFSRKRRLQFEQFRTSGFVFKHPYKSKFENAFCPVPKNRKGKKNPPQFAGDLVLFGF